MNKWMQRSLGDLVKFKAGNAFPKELQGCRHGDLPFIKVSDMNREENWRDLKGAENWLEAITANSQRATVHEVGSVAFAKIGIALTYNRRRRVVQPTLLDNNMMSAAGKSDEIDPDFLYYLLRTIDFNVVSAGSALPYLTVGALNEIKVHIPSLSQQMKISAALGSLDDKIELNRQMNETLEAMSQAIFRDWFVDFGPTRRKLGGVTDPVEIMGGLVTDAERAQQLADLFPSSLDDNGLPAGWEEKPLSDFGRIVTGKTPSTRIAEFFGQDVPFLKIPDMHGQIFVLETSMNLSSAGAASQPKQTVPAGSISVSCIATPGLVVMNHRAVQTNQQINTLVPSHSVWSPFLFWSCRQLSAEVLRAGSGGSVFHNMNKSTFSGLTIISPGDQELYEAFNNLISPLHDGIYANCAQNVTLAATRDLLLPKLMSGEIELRDVEDQLEAAQ